jgi:methanogenic corrinoid protein MtbC1
MLRRVALDIAGSEDHISSPHGLSPAVLTQALGSLVSQRQAAGNAALAIERFGESLLSDDPGAAKVYIGRLIACGVSIEAIYDNFIPRAAAWLGDRWLEDELSFTAVTLGMARLTEVFRSVSPAFLKEGRRRPGRERRALFALVPGEEHCLGIVMAADHFQRAGWSVRVELRAGRDALEELAATGSFDLIGLSIGSRRLLPAAETTLATLRAAARPGTRFAIGGALARLERGLAAQLGADLDAGTVKRALYEVDRVT